MSPASDILRNLRRRRVTFICHMTPCERLPSIFKASAILSLRERTTRGIDEPPTPHFWGAPERKQQLADYLCCAFTAPWGLLQHREEFAILVLDAKEVCSQRGTLFCADNTAKSAYSVAAILGMSGAASLDACFPTRDSNRALLQTEILVRDAVPLQSLRHIVFCDQAAREYWTRTPPHIRRAGFLGRIESRVRPLPRYHVHHFDRFTFPPTYVPARRTRK